MREHESTFGWKQNARPSKGWFLWRRSNRREIPARKRCPGMSFVAALLLDKIVRSSGTCVAYLGWLSVNLEGFVQDYRLSASSQSQKSDNGNNIKQRDRLRYTSHTPVCKAAPLWHPVRFNMYSFSCWRIALSITCWGSPV